MTISVRLALSVAAVVSMVIMVTFSPQLTIDITVSRVGFIWRPVASWLRPPYLYLVINCIIITIFASSKLHEHHRDYSEPVRLFPTDDHCVGEDQRELVDLPQSSTGVECVEFSDEAPGNENNSLPTTRIITCVNDVQVVDSDNANVRCSDEGTAKGANVETWKLPGSESFIHPKDVQLDTQGRKKLGAQKPEKELKTLESTWKAITDGRPMPTTHQYSGGNLQDPRNMIKSEIFNQQASSNRSNISRTLAGSSGWGKLSRDPSLGQDELNKRAEEFISRFKEDMRLQRKESLRQYVEMINSSAY
ncbi:hypothetical protein ACET3Z_021606 [Daucus carota]